MLNWGTQQGSQRFFGWAGVPRTDAKFHTSVENKKSKMVDQELVVTWNPADL